MGFEITERWLMDAGGWQAMKAARAAWKAGAVLSVEFDGTRLRGQVRAGGRTLAAGLVIKSRTEVTNLCGCPVSRRDGALCEHSLALGLGWVHRGNGGTTTEARAGATRGEKNPLATKAPGTTHDTRAGRTPPAEKPTPRTSGALSITLPATFFDGLRRNRLAVSMRQAPSSQPETEADRAVHAWLAAQKLTTLPPQIALSDRSQIEAFLLALVGHPGISHSGKPLAVVEGGWRLPLQVVQERKKQVLIAQRQGVVSGPANRTSYHSQSRRDPETEDTTTPKDPLNLEIDSAALESTRWWAGPGRGFLLHSKSATLFIFNEISLIAPFFDESGSARPAAMSWAWLARHGDALSEVFKLDEADPRWPTLRLVPATPRIRLVLEGSLKRLTAAVWCGYDGIPEFSLPASLLKPDPFPLADPVTSEVFWDRNVEAERAAIARLTRAGFAFDPGDKQFVLNGEANILQFYAGELATLERDWAVEWGSRANEVFRGLERITPQFREVATGNDWLAFDLAMVGSSGSTVTATEARRWLQTGQGAKCLPNGKLAVLARETFEDLEAVLRDLSPSQEQGHFRVAAEQRAYLEASIPPAVGRRGDDKLKRIDDSVLISNDWHKILRPYQQTGAHWMLRLATSGRGGILADEMGLGKTIQTLAVIESMKTQTDGDATNQRPCLVVAPTSLLGNWREEAARFAPSLDVVVVRSGERAGELAALGRADLVITSYQLLVRDLDHHRAVEYATVFLDEAGFIRNADTQAAKAVRRLRTGARFALTGTPIENSIRDLWAIMDFALPGYLGRRDDFRDHYEAPVLAGNSAALQRLRRRMAPYWLRRLKQEVARDLPAKIEKVVRCELTPTQRDMYAAIQREGVRKVEEARQARTTSQARVTLLTALLRLRQTCGDPRLLGEAFPDRDPAEYSTKWAALVELLEEIRDGGHNVLIFSQFATQLRLLEPALTGVGLDFCRLDGASRDREAQVAAFRDDPAKRAFLISLKAGGFGLNLTKADTVIHFDPWWNPAVEAQATDRAHRIGQARPVTVYKLITTGTVEEKILALQQRKRQLMETALADDTAPLMEGLDDAALQELLRE
jgi:superfamily II DNA or RNA helicase